MCVSNRKQVEHLCVYNKNQGGTFVCITDNNVKYCVSFYVHYTCAIFVRTG